MSKAFEQAQASRTFTTYNFEVEDYHTYFAGSSAVWVHNQGLKPCQLARSGLKAMVDRGESTWVAFRGTLAKFNYDDIGSRTRLKIFNETRSEVLAGRWAGGNAPWEDLSRQLRGLGPVGSDSYLDQVNGLAGNPKLLGNNLKATGIEAPWGGSDGGALAAHHIVAAGEQYPSAIQARKILADAGIDVNEASNGVFLARNAADSDLSKAIHSGRHSEAYSDIVRDRLLQLAGNPQALREELQKIADHLVNVGWLP